MRGKRVIAGGVVLAVLIMFFLYPAFAQENLVGKYVKIDGPRRCNYLGAARNGRAYRAMSSAVRRNNKTRFENVLKHSDIVTIKNHTPAYVLDVDLFKDKARILVLDGLQEGATGWIPLSWLKNNPQDAKLWQ